MIEAEHATHTKYQVAPQTHYSGFILLLSGAQLFELPDASGHDPRH